MDTITPPPQRELIGISYSPWTEKARWSLDFHHLDYRYSEHLIMLGMPALRLKMKSFTGELTVPALIDGETRVMDSFEIAKYADKISASDRKLISDEKLGLIKSINALSEAALDAGRALVMSRIARDPEAQRESLPSFIPKFARGVCRPIVAMGLGYLDREFLVSGKSVETRQDELDRVIFELDQMVRTRQGDFILGQFSFADIAIALAAQVLTPVSNEYIKLPEALRRCWANPQLAEKYAALVRWRDFLYTKCRRV